MADTVVVVLDNLSRGHRSSLRETPLLEGDLGDAGLVERTLGEWKIEAVMDFGALAYGFDRTLEQLQHEKLGSAPIRQ